MKFLLKTENRIKIYQLMSELLVSDLFLEATPWFLTSHILMFGDLGKAISAIKNAGVSDEFYFKVTSFPDNKDNIFYHRMVGAQQYFEKIYTKLYEIFNLAVTNLHPITLTYENKEITFQDALKKLIDMLYIPIMGIIISISGDNQFLKLKFNSSFQRINFLHELGQNSDTNEDSNDDKLDYNIPVNPRGDWFFFMISSELRGIFLNSLLFPPGFIQSKDQTILEINRSQLENKQITIPFKQPRLGCDFCIFTSAVLKHRDISMPNVLKDVITDYCSHGYV